MTHKKAENVRNEQSLLCCVQKGVGQERVLCRREERSMTGAHKGEGVTMT